MEDLAPSSPYSTITPQLVGNELRGFCVSRLTEVWLEACAEAAVSLAGDWPEAPIWSDQPASEMPPNLTRLPPKGSLTAVVSKQLTGRVMSSE
jgi:hypothetical protein